VSPNNRHKIVFIGPSAAGKTSIIHRFAKRTFQDHDPTIGTAFYSRELQVRNGTVCLNVWDTAGMEQYKSLVPRYARGASAAVVVFDITDPVSFASARELLIDAPNSAGDDVITFFVGNKVDCPSGLDLGEIRQFCRVQNAVYWETSAKTGENIEELFKDIADRVSSRDMAAPGIDILGEPDGNSGNENPPKSCC
jgi:small GTP-binding protein